MPAESPSSDLLFDQAPCGLLVTQGNGCIERVNGTFCRLLGRERDALVGLRFQNLLTMGGKIFSQTHWFPVLQMQGSVLEVKLDLLHADGRLVPMMLNAVRREHQGVLYHELALFVAEERNQYERQLLEARKLAEELLHQQMVAQQELSLAQNRLRLAHAEAQIRATFAEQMVGIVSHDLRNPLSAIKMAADLLQRGPLDTRQSRVAGHISQSVDRAGRLIADLLDFTQARVGQGLTVDSQPVDLHAVAERSIEELRLAFPHRSLIHVRLGEGACKADADRLFQVIGNLVSNAFSYGDPYAPVTVTSAFDAKGSYLAVHNHGEVIAPELFEQLFEPLVRGVVHDTRRSVGLGLFIVREIMRAHLGDISVQSSTEHGTIFTARLPRVF